MNARQDAAATDRRSRLVAIGTPLRSIRSAKPGVVPSIE